MVFFSFSAKVHTEYILLWDLNLLQLKMTWTHSGLSRGANVKFGKVLREFTCDKAQTKDLHVS